MSSAHAAGFKRFEHGRQDDGVWHGARDVGDNDGGFSDRAHEAAQRRAGNRLFDRGADGGCASAKARRAGQSTVAVSGTMASMPCSP
jgi:hypothetical protein